MLPMIRPGNSSDLAQIASIYNGYVERTSVTFDVTPITEADRLPWLEQHSAAGRHRLLVAVDGRQLLGWATTSPFRPRAAYETTVESSVYCSPEHQGRGVGSQLYRALFESLQEEDVERIVAGVTLPNPASVRLHRRFFFRRVGTFHRVGRKFGRYWDVAWFERPLRVASVDSEGPARPSTEEMRSGPA
jgi:phosphinothricin acetyltransferase